MPGRTPPALSPVDCKSLVRLLLAAALPLAGGPLAVCGGSPADPPAPVAVSGIAGVTYLTVDPAPLRRFYGQGAGLAEAPAGPGAVRFAVGTRQWIEFETVPDSHWPRRLQYVTLEVPSLTELDRALNERGVPSRWMGSDPRSRFLQFADPSGDLLRAEEPRPPTAVPSGAAAPFSGHLQHVGFAVARSQARATMAFYRDTLGWPEAVRMADPDGRLAMAKFRLPGPRGELIELILFDPPLNKWAAGAFDHVNFEVADIDSAYRALHRGGIANQAKHLPTVNGERLWAINLTDPELTRIEIQVLAPTHEAIGTVSAAGADPADLRTR